MELTTEFQVLFFKVWYSGKVPPSLRGSIAATVFKKGSRNDCANHRGIILNSSGKTASV